MLLLIPVKAISTWHIKHCLSSFRFQKIISFASMENFRSRKLHKIIKKTSIFILTGKCPIQPGCAGSGQRRAHSLAISRRTHHSRKSRWVASVIHKAPPPPLVDRVTLTLPVLNAAANIHFLVFGSYKATWLAQVLNGSFQPALLRPQAMKPVKGRSLWLTDQAAAA